MFKKKTVLFFFVFNFTVNSIVLFSSDLNKQRIFFVINSDLRRIGYEEFKKFVCPETKSEIYHLSPDFKLAIGDSVIVNLSGKLQENYKLIIDKDGKIMLPPVGEIYILGLTINEARKTIQTEINKKYLNVKVGFNIINVQPIRVSVLGEVQNPGIYSLSAFSKLVEGITNAGGPSPLGSLINIKLIRNRKEIVNFNVYDYIFDAEESKNVLLNDGDILFVPEFKNLVVIRGDVVLPGIYEFYNGEKVSDIIKRARGLIPRNIPRKISVIRLDTIKGTIVKIKEMNISSLKDFNNENDFLLENEDTILVTTELDKLVYPQELYKIVRFTGEVKNPGEYIIEEGEKLSSVIKRAGGLTDYAFLDGTVFIRKSLIKEEKQMIDQEISSVQLNIMKNQERLTNAILTEEEKKIIEKTIEEQKKYLDFLRNKEPTGRMIINLEDVLNGKDDVILQNGDEIFIPKNPEYVIVSGEVFNPVSLKFIPGKDFKYYIEKSGGITKFGDVENIYIRKANGKCEPVSNGSIIISSGDTIIVPKKIFSDYKIFPSTTK